MLLILYGCLLYNYLCIVIAGISLVLVSVKISFALSLGNLVDVSLNVSALFVCLEILVVVDDFRECYAGTFVLCSAHIIPAAAGFFFK